MKNLCIIPACISSKRIHGKADTPNAEKYYDHCLSLPMYPTLTDQEQRFMISKIISFYNQNP